MMLGVIKELWVQKIILMSLCLGLSSLCFAEKTGKVTIDCVASLSGEDPNIRRFLLAHDVDVKWIRQRMYEYSAGISRLALAGPTADLRAIVRVLKENMVGFLNTAELGIADGGRFSQYENFVSIKLNSSAEPQQLGVKDPIFLQAKRLEFRRIEAYIDAETTRLNVVAATEHLRRQGFSSFAALKNLASSPPREWWEKTMDNAILESVLLFPRVEDYRRSVASFGQAGVAQGFTTLQLQGAIFNGPLPAPLAFAFHNYVNAHRIFHENQPTIDTYGETARERADEFVRNVLSRSTELFGTAP